jgi:hypothetical protein
MPLDYLLMASLACIVGPDMSMIGHLAISIILRPSLLRRGVAYGGKQKSSSYKTGIGT